MSTQKRAKLPASAQASPACVGAGRRRPSRRKYLRQVDGLVTNQNEFDDSSSDFEEEEVQAPSGAASACPSKGRAAAPEVLPRSTISPANRAVPQPTISHANRALPQPTDHASIDRIDTQHLLKRIHDLLPQRETGVQVVDTSPSTQTATQANRCQNIYQY